ncbi:Hypothetical Protein FCC1311_034632 [Hondaea fermentalgiana]|uniref:Uncharacterized protein n=1 Tax=Hondaea fermentalgiana TaxID=2315210 RepID=A0A2R5GG68_9STRA|nr:Hypothetical Protein FCC1311_034632 [Hondaea fermentalgiana]|eukprot:GBG27241.1 Hypothetical Protein FCC1311_034632 [Hondaea fermentalgiana]
MAPIVGKQFKDFTMTSAEDGSRRKLSSMAGKGTSVVILVVANDFASECVPFLQALEDFALAKPEVRCIVLNNADDAATAQDLLGDQDITHCESFTGTLPTFYGMRAGVYPFHIVINSAGGIVAASEDTVDLSSFFGSDKITPVDPRDSKAVTGGSRAEEDGDEDE